MDNNNETKSTQKLGYNKKSKTKFVKRNKRKDIERMQKMNTEKNREIEYIK